MPARAPDPGAPYYQDDAVTIYHGDCREILPHLSGVDLVFTSPPYNLGAQSGAYANMRDGYAGHADNMPDAEYVAWELQILRNLWRLVAPSGAIFYNHKPIIRDGVALLPTRLVPDEAALRQVLIWDRKIGMNWSPSHFCPQHEWILLLAWPGFRLRDRCISCHQEQHGPPVTDHERELIRRRITSAIASRGLLPARHLDDHIAEELEYVDDLIEQGYDL